MTKLIPHKVTIGRSSNGLGNSYHYKGKPFAFVWAWKPFSNEWWLNLLLFANVSSQDALKAGKAIAKRKGALQ